MSEKDSYKKIVAHYEECLEKYGDTHLGVDWPKLDDLHKRYAVMLELIRFKSETDEITLLDFGCGNGMFLDFILQQSTYKINYSGLDLSPKFVDLCKRKFPKNTFYCSDLLQEPYTIPVFDYVVMNGVFTEKRDLSFNEMFDYFKKLVSLVFEKTNKGIAFNVMSKAVDWERDDLFHLSTDLLIDFLTKKLSRNFIIRNDYGLYEYSVYLYK